MGSLGLAEGLSSLQKIARPLFDWRVVLPIPADLPMARGRGGKAVICGKVRVIIVTDFERAKSSF